MHNSARRDLSIYVAFRNFERLELFEYPELKEIWYGQVRETQEDDNIEMQHGKVSSNLEELSLNGNDAMRILNGHCDKIFFTGIEILRLQYFQETPIMFLNDILERFPSTTMLQVRYSSFDTLFPSDEIGECNNKSPAQIKNLWLYQLKQLTNIWNDESLSDSIAEILEYLSVWDCSSLMRLAPPSISFKNLTALTVKDCKGLVYLMTSYTAKSLVLLKYLTIENCEMIEDVQDMDGQPYRNSLGVHYRILDQHLFFAPISEALNNTNHAIKCRHIMKVMRVSVFNEGKKTRIMEFVGTIWEATTCIWRCASKHGAYICDLKENLDELATQWNEVGRTYNDVKRRVEQAEITGHMERTEQVDGWLKSVDRIEEIVRVILQEDGPQTPNNCCCVASYKFGKKVTKTINDIEKLKATGQNFSNDVIVYQIPRGKVDEMPIGKTVGMDLMIDKVWDSIQKENVGIIGLYGMGGVGKTTLLKRINNEFAKRFHGFDVVIWVVVSKDHSTGKIMDVIRKKLHIAENLWINRSEDERVAEIYRVMKHKKFVLMLDDIWEQIDLQNLGVPLLEDNNRSKVLFTTRFENVCDQMQAQKIFKVECLTEKEALDLFCMKVGEESLNSHPKIPKLAQQIVTECQGLPLALITLGAAMAGRKSLEAWNHAIKEITSSPSEVPGMQDKVFYILKFSFDRLPTATHKKCFLYCALFPEDYKIVVNDLIDLMVGEGFLNDSGSIYDAYNHGKFVLESLKLACLLESDDDIIQGSIVKMHDVIRDMALWLARDEDQKKFKVLVEGEAVVAPVMSEPNVDLYKVVDRISIIEAEANWHIPPCPNLSTLIVRRKTCISNFSNFQCMNRLKVLDLSRNRRMLEIPSEIGHLIHLEFLNLSRTFIQKRFPIEMKNLKNLKVLLMEFVHFSLEILPLEVISSLERLRVFRFFSHDLFADSGSDQKPILEKLESLPLLEELSIEVQTATGMEKLLGSTKLLSCVRKMILNQIATSINMSSLLASMSKVKHLKQFVLNGISQTIMEDSAIDYTWHFGNLSSVDISYCHSLIHLTWVKYAPLLKYLSVGDYKSMEVVIEEDEDEDEEDKEKMDSILFSSLVCLNLWELPNLKIIHRRALPFACLKYMYISKCPNMKKLPLDSNSACKSLRDIGVEKQWWNNLEWEDEATKDLLQSKLTNI
ncbi:putative disease resistance protein [Senna tora]|uniref:Putative disease resistance protein n=1 Tax=Senna tora TaxID=362788 RepID=A0A834XK37_9FABA|nr:putative disease resistance protein [Senna tora]